MRATQRELDGELIRWVALDPATISPAVQPCKRTTAQEKEKLTSVSAPFQSSPSLAFACALPLTPQNRA